VNTRDKPALNLDVETGHARGITMAVVIGIPALLVVGFLFLLITYRSNVEYAVSRLAALLPVGYAFSAGMVASVNPCGFMMLPTYIFYHVGSHSTGFQGSNRIANRMMKGLTTALIVTAGFILVFSLVGIIITLGGQWLVNIFPYAGFLIGVLMLGAGVYMLISGQTFGIAAAGRLRVNPQHTLSNMFTFGIIYATGSLSCTLPIFLVVIGSALASGNPALSIGQFLGYALGMGSMILFITQAVVLFQVAVTRWLQRFSSLVHRFNAFFMVGAGAYLVVYWLFIAGLS
jgi:cytochrome c-type biogenesis protein